MLMIHEENENDESRQGKEDDDLDRFDQLSKTRNNNRCRLKVILSCYWRILLWYLIS